MKRYRITYQFMRRKNQAVFCNAVSVEEAKKFTVDNWPEDAIYASVEVWETAFTLTMHEGRLELKFPNTEERQPWQ